MTTIFQCIKASSRASLEHDKELVKLNFSKLLKTFLTVRKVIETIKQIAKQVLGFLQLSVFKKHTSVRNYLGIADLALEGTGSSAVLFFLIFFFFILNWKKKLLFLDKALQFFTETACQKYYLYV